MSIELKVPDVGESIQEVQIGKWFKQEGDRVELDEDVVELETDKASMELAAPADGVLAEILKREGDAVSIGDVIARIEEKDGSAKEAEDEPQSPPAEAEQDDDEPSRENKQADEAAVEEPEEEKRDSVPATPAARRALRKHGLKADEVRFEGKQLRPEDVERHVKEKEKESAASAEEPSREQPSATSSASDDEAELEQVVRMSLIRRRIAARLVEAQQQAALLTTFNEIDMSAVIELRREYRKQFQEEYGIDLGFMPFFVKAAIDALRHFPEINAEIRGDNIVYRNYYHIGIAIGGGKGLVVPVLRFAERMSFADIEEAIADFARRAESSKLEPDDLQGGTFTITNGGVYGSLLSTPIVNPPQSGVLGMHAIQQRPVGRDGQIVLRPMMYIALTYDHRIVDGREAVSFLKRLKEAIEEPARMLIEV